MTPIILIFFVLFSNGSQASVRVGFSTDEMCAMAAREMSEKVKALGGETTWACVRQ